MNEKNFLDNWGQSTEEICTNLNYDSETSDDLLIIDYFYYNDLWIPKLSSLYSNEEQNFADSLRYKN